MVDNEIIKEWITKADQDFEFARINLEEEKQFFAQICFHFNQSAEKYLKAFIIAMSICQHFILKRDILSTGPLSFQQKKPKRRTGQQKIFVIFSRKNYKKVNPEPEPATVCKDLPGSKAIETYNSSFAPYNRCRCF